MYIYLYIERTNLDRSIYGTALRPVIHKEGGDGRVNVSPCLSVYREGQSKPSNLPRGFQRFGFVNHFRAGGFLRFRVRVRCTYGSEFTRS